MSCDCHDCGHGVSDIDPSTGEFDFACPYMDICGNGDGHGNYTFPKWVPIRGDWE